MQYLHTISRHLALEASTPRFFPSFTGKKGFGEHQRLLQTLVKKRYFSLIYIILYVQSTLLLYNYFIIVFLQGTLELYIFFLFSGHNEAAYKIIEKILDYQGKPLEDMIDQNSVLRMSRDPFMDIVSHFLGQFKDDKDQSIQQLVKVKILYFIVSFFLFICVCFSLSLSLYASLFLFLSHTVLSHTVLLYVCFLEIHSYPKILCLYGDFPFLPLLFFHILIFISSFLFARLAGDCRGRHSRLRR